FSIVLEAMPATVAARITEAVQIPTIGIGAGASCGGQVLVWHDLLGVIPGPTPRFVKQYADVATTMRTAIETYAKDVRAGPVPGDRHTYSMPEQERQQLDSQIQPRRPVGTRR